MAIIVAFVRKTINSQHFRNSQVSKERFLRKLEPFQFLRYSVMLDMCFISETESPIEIFEFTTNLQLMR